MYQTCLGVTVSFAGLIATSLVGFAQTADHDGPIILTIERVAFDTDMSTGLKFDLRGLEALGVTEVATTTIWTDGVQRFEGVSLKVLADVLNVTEGGFEAWAANDYLAEIPITDAVENGPIIAYRLNGAEMSLREKGPLWLIYPYDSDPRYRSEVIYSRSVWQLDRILVVH